jgi:serine/threonine protein kinase
MTMSDATNDPSSWVGRYHLDRVIADQGSVRRYLARDVTGQRFVLKELSLEHAPSASTAGRFERDFALLMQLQHPSLPRVFESFHDEASGHAYSVEEWVDGQSLRDWLAFKRFDQREVLAIGRQLLAVVGYLHGLSPAIYHRDIRPENVILLRDGTIKLINFASARDLSVTGAFTMIGDVGYAPAEQLAGIADATSDLYAAGATLIYLLTRREPWRDEDLGLSHANVNPWFRSFLERLTARDPSQRYPSAAEAHAALSPPARRASRSTRVPLTLRLRDGSEVPGTQLGFVPVTLLPLWISLPLGILLLPPVLMLLFVLLAPATSRSWVPRGHHGYDAPLAPHDDGRVFVDSRPSGAAIWLDGKPMTFDNGEQARTPSDLTGLARGVGYMIRLEKEGYAPEERGFVLGPDAPGRPMSVTLVPQGREPKVDLPTPE